MELYNLQTRHDFLQLLYNTAAMSMPQVTKVHKKRWGYYLMYDYTLKRNIQQKQNFAC